MIRTDKQVSWARAQIAGLEAALARLEGRRDLPPAAKRASLDSIKCELAGIKFELDEYEALKQNEVWLPEVASFQDAVEALPKFRMALHISLDELEKMVGVSRKTLGQYEEQGYQRAPFHIVLQVMHVLGLEAGVQMRCPKVTIRQPEPPTGVAMSAVEYGSDPLGIREKRRERQRPAALR